MKILERFPASHPRGQFPAEEYARKQRDAGIPDAEVIMSLPSDEFHVVTRQREER